MYDSQDNLSISTTCPTCLTLDAQCAECLESAEARASDIAHEIVDERNEIYPRQWLINRPMPSGHDWTERDGEFLPPIHLITDGGELDTLWELDDEVQAKRETECNWCHILTPKQFNDCQSCDRPLESNVR